MFPGDAGRPKFNHLEMVTIVTDKPSLVRIDVRNFRVVVVTDPPTNKQTGTITIHCATTLLAQSVINANHYNMNWVKKHMISSTE